MASTVYTRTFTRALDTAGDISRLARHLDVKAEDLQGWLDGTAMPPTDAFLAALDLVARGTTGLQRFQ